MLEEIFNGPKNDPLLRAADYVQGAYSILTGVAANKSMATNQPVTISDLVKGLPEPVFPEMRGQDGHIAFVPSVSRMAGGMKMDANVPLRLEAPQ